MVMKNREKNQNFINLRSVTFDPRRLNQDKREEEEVKER